MSDINISVDSSQVIGGQKALDDFGAAFGKLVAKLNREERQITAALKAPWEIQERAIDQTVAALQQAATISSRENQKIINSLLGVTNSYKSAEDSAEAFTSALREQERIASQVASKNQAAFNAVLGVSGSRATDSGASFSAMEAEIDRLAQKYNALYASSKIYENTLLELNKAHAMGVLSTKQHAQAVDQLEAEYQQFQAGTAGFGNRFAHQTDLATRANNQLGVVVQQTGYQVGDFLVQVQSGTNWMVAFGQQATQLVGTLPLLSTTLGVSAGSLIAISTGLGIAIPLVTALGAAWMRTRDSAEDSGSKTVDVIKKLQEETRTLQNQWDSLKFGSPESGDLERLKEQASELRSTLVDLNEAAANSLGNRLNLVNTYGPAIANAEAELALVVEKTNKLEEELRLRRESQAQLEKANSINAGMQAVELGHARAIGQSKREQAAAVERIHRQMIAVQEAQQKSNTFAKLLREELEKSGVNASKLSNVDIASGIWGGAAAALALAERLGIALSNAESLSSIAAYEASGSMDAAARRNATTMGKEGGVLASGAGGVRTYPKGSKSSGGSGGGGSNSKLESLISELQTERETLEIWYEESQLLLEKAGNAELEILGGKYEAKLRLEEEYQERLREIKETSQNQQLTELGTFFGAMASVAQAGGSKYLKVAQTLAAAEALINTYLAQSQVLRDPKLGFFGKMAAYATIGAAGLRLVSALKGGGSGGGGASSTPSSATVSQSEPAQSPQTVYVDNIDPNSFYTGEALIRLFEAFYSENDKRGKVFVVRS